MADTIATAYAEKLWDAVVDDGFDTPASVVAYFCTALLLEEATRHCGFETFVTPEHGDIQPCWLWWFEDASCLLIGGINEGEECIVGALPPGFDITHLPDDGEGNPVTLH